jgi:uncharacterized protein
MPITAFYAALLAPLFILLAVRVIRQRRGARVAIGDGGDKLLLRRMRVHANFAEYVPFALVLMCMPWVCRRRRRISGFGSRAWPEPSR